MSPSGIPPHRPLTVEGVHAYTDRVSVAAGESIRFHVSSSHPYELQVCRLGTDVDSPSRDEILHSFGRSPAGRPADPPRLVSDGRQASGRLGPLCRADARGLDPALAHDRTAGDHRPVRPAGCLRIRVVRQRGRFARVSISATAAPTSRRTCTRRRPTNCGWKSIRRVSSTSPTTRPARCSPTTGITSLRGSTATLKQIWVDGRRVVELGAYPARCGPAMAALRIGAAGQEGVTTAFLDADIAMPAIYARALSPAEIAARFADRGLSRPTGPDMLACWPLNEERGERVADASPHGRHATDHQQRDVDDRRARASTPMCPGSATYDPANDPRRGHGLRLASDDLFDCRWKATHEYRLPENARSGIYACRIRFQLDGEERLYHTVFIVQEGGRTAQGADRVPVLDQYLEGLRGHAVLPDVERAQEIDRQQRVRQQPGRSAGVLLLSPASGRPGDISVGLPDALADRRSLHAHGPRGVGLQPPLPAGSVHAGLAGDSGLRLRRPERHRLASRSGRPGRLQGAVRRRAQRILVVRGDGRREPIPGSGRQCGGALGEHGVLAGVVQCRRVASSSAARGTPRGPRSAPTAAARCGTATTAAAAGWRANAASRPGDSSGWSTSRSSASACRASARTRSATPTTSSFGVPTT